jgi:glycolate oxidase iron-sulfur subunit
MGAGGSNQITVKDSLTVPAITFDSNHPPSVDLMNQCVHCGFCLPACPTYALWGQEADSPRGRIYLMKMASDGLNAMTPEWVNHFDTCLGCMSCMTACPSGVDYGKLIEATRSQIERLHERSFWDKLHRRILFSVLPRPDLLRLLRGLLAYYQSSGLQTLVRKSRALKLFPRRLRSMETLLPKLGARDEISDVTPATPPERARVGLLLGCVQREFLSDVNAATVRVLAAEGCEVIAPPDQPCCGALLSHAGEERSAADLAKQIIDTFEAASVDTIITNAGGCGSCVKEYAHLLRDTEYADRAKAFSAKCRDVTEFLDELGPRAVRHPLSLRVGYHDSCHLQHAQRVCTQPRSLLAAIPELQVLEIPESSICCGSAGIYNLVQPETADALADRKASLIAPLKADAIATGNPGCILQMRSALARNGQTSPVVHTIQLVDASIRNSWTPPNPS